MSKEFIKDLYKQGRLKAIKTQTFDNESCDMIVIIYIDINYENNVLNYISGVSYDNELDALLDNESLITHSFRIAIMEGKLCV